MISAIVHFTLGREMVEGKPIWKPNELWIKSYYILTTTDHAYSNVLGLLRWPALSFPQWSQYISLSSCTAPSWKLMFFLFIPSGMSLRILILVIYILKILMKILVITPYCNFNIVDSVFTPMFQLPVFKKFFFVLFLNYEILFFLTICTHSWVSSLDSSMQIAQCSFNGSLPSIYLWLYLMNSLDVFLGRKLKFDYSPCLLLLRK